MAEKKFKFVMVKFIFFLLFVYMLINFFSTMREKYHLLKDKKEKTSSEFISLFTIRDFDFYKKNEKVKTEKIENLEKKDEKNTKKKTDTVKLKKYFVTIATYSRKENAEIKLKQLKAFNIKIDEVESKNKTYYRIISDDFNDIKEADKFVQEIKKVSANEKPLIRVRY